MERKPDDRSAARWQQVEALFAEALDVSPDQRAAFLDAACAGAPLLRAEVASLLEALGQAGNFLEGIDPARAAALIESTEAAELEGYRIGPYRIVREIGHGGMGAVYLAERAAADEKAQFQQEVALKLIKRGMDSEEILRRFLNERQILARLQHPNVARLLDGGVTEEGQPYFVMEYVGGLPIDVYCDQRQLNLDRRLQLFAEVCRAVQFAHQNLVVHRDLKPSNILVTGDGRVKLLDFGIAKVLEAEEEEGATVLTTAGRLVMTPEYAAPEQARGEMVTTATDVYALGVVLYELLTGHRPYAFPSRTPEEIARVICETEPPRPSTAISRLTEQRRRDGTSETITPARVSQARATHIEKLRRQLAGDLDTIVLKALRKEPERRYASAEAFVEDIKRYLAGQPVQARRDTLGYRMQKFVRRHKAGVLTAVLVLASLAGGLSAALWQAQAKAREAAKAEAVKDFLVSLFEVSDPALSKGEPVTAQELLDRGLARVDQELQNQPETQAEMLAVLGRVYLEMGHLDEAEPLLRRALAMQQRLYGAEHPEVASRLNDLGELMHDRGDFDATETFFREALAMRRRLFGEAHVETATSLSNLALLFNERGDYDEAEPLMRQVLALERKLFSGENQGHVAVSLNNLAFLLETKGDYEAAEPLYREALAIMRTLREDVHPNTATFVGNLGRLFYKKGDYAAAEPLYEEALAILRKLYPEANYHIGLSLNNLGLLFYTRGHQQKADSLYREALRVWRSLPQEHPGMAFSLQNLGRQRLDEGRHEEARALFSEALDVRRRLLGAEHPLVAVSMNGLALSLHRSGHSDAAESLMREALALQRRTLGSGHPSTAVTLQSLADLLRDREAFAAADSLYQEVLALRRRALAEDHPRIASVLIGLGQLRISQHRPEDAEPLLREAWNLYRHKYGDVDERTAQAKLKLGRCLTILERYEEAEPLLLESHEVLQTLAGAAHETTREARQALASFYATRRGTD